MDNYTLVRIFLILLAIVTLFVLVSRYTQKQKQSQSERFYEDVSSLLPLVKNGGIDKSMPTQVQPSEQVNDEDYKAVDYNDEQLPNDCFPKDRLTADDLLPSDAANSRWAQLNPSGQGDVKDQNFLQAGYHVGLNTTQGNHRNANLQLRSDPIIKRENWGPVMNSTIVPDLLRRPLEIGETDCS